MFLEGHVCTYAIRNLVDKIFDKEFKNVSRYNPSQVWDPYPINKVPQLEI